MFDLLFEYAQPVQWWVYIVLGAIAFGLVVASGAGDSRMVHELQEHWKDADRLKGKMLNERYDLVSFNNGKSYYRVYKSGRLELAPEDLVAMVKAHKAAESMGLDPYTLEQISPIFTRKAPLPVDIDGDGKPAGERNHSSPDEKVLLP